ncbi:hypothetical protein ES705_28533 [subsurface metagenome]
MKNPKFNPESSSGLNPVSGRTLDVRLKQYLNSNFRNNKRFGHLSFEHLDPAHLRWAWMNLFTLWNSHYLFHGVKDFDIRI